MTRRKIIAFLATACIATSIALLIMLKTANAEEIYLPDGRTETAVCTVFFTEPARIVCESRHAICSRYEWTNQYSCEWKPVKNSEDQ